MSEEDTLQYINSFVNREESLSSLLDIYINISKSQTGSIFLQEGIGNKHICIEHVGYSEFLNLENDFQFEPMFPISNIVVINKPGYKEYITPYKLFTVLVIPITVNNDRLGVVCLANSKEGYSEDIISPLTSCISLTQLILNKTKLIRDFKKVYSGSTSFSKDLFLANMSHEIRTPLNGVIGYNQLLMQTSLTITQKRYLMSMNQCSIQLMQIINDVLDFSKLASGKMNMNSECFRINEIIDAVKDAMGTRINEKKQKIKFIIEEDLPEFIISDKQKIIQIVINLVSNASKFSEIEGHIEVIFSDNLEKYIHISVRDNGIGISEQNQYKLFNPFMQIEESLCKVGTGLGLAICKKLVTLLDGEIFVKSSIDIGSTFSFTIKYEQYENFERIIERDVEFLKGKSILVVDDNADNRILLGEILFEWGMNPVMCASALEALRMVLGDRYKFVLGLIDICMPGTTGVELAEQIKEERPFFPLIAISSVDSFVSSSYFEKQLDKPINNVQLFNAIYHVISKNQSPDTYLGSYSECDSHNSNSPSSRYSKESRILIAEDIAYNRTLLINMLENLKYDNVDSAENGEIALSMIMQEYEKGDPYDIILLDLRMPIMSGYDTMRALNKLKMKLPDIVIISASVMDDDKNKCKLMGAKYFITKPIEMQQLKNVMLHLSDNEKD